MPLDQIDVVKALYTFIEKCAFGDDLVTSSGNQDMLIFANPGIYLGKAIDETKPSQLIIQSEALDVNLDAAFVYKTLGDRLSRYWSEIVNAEMHPQDNENASDEIGRIDAWMTANTPTYIAQQTAYLNAQKAYFSAANADPDDPDLPQLQADVDNALAAWTLKAEHDELQNRRVYLTTYDPNKFWSAAADAQVTQLRTGGAPPRNFYPVFLKPSVADWQSDAGFSHITFDYAQHENDTHSTATAWSGSASVGWGFWSFNASYSHSEQTQYEHHEANSLHIEFDMMRVAVDRSSWFDPDLLEGKGWAWQLEHSNDVISDGTTPPTGRMPIVIDQVLVAKNISVTGDFEDSTYKFFASHDSASGGFGFCCFSFGGSYSKDVSDTSSVEVIQGSGIKTVDPQIIGFYARMLPASPNPDTSLEGWPHPPRPNGA